MIKNLKVMSAILFAVSLLLFGGVTVYSRVSEDKTAPVIEMDDSEITVSTKDAREAVLAGVKAYDDKDGDVSGQLIVESMGNFIEKGVRKATITAFDESGNVTKASRTVRYSDYMSPKFYLNGPLYAQMGETDRLFLAVGATDCLDGDIREQVQIISEKEISDVTEGSYEVRLRAVNSAGDVAELPVTVNVYDNAGYQKERPMLSTYLVYVKEGEKVDAKSYLTGVTVGGYQYPWDKENPLGIRKDSVYIEDRTDYSMPGVYEIVYTILNEDGSLGGSVSLIVVVEA